MKYRLNIVVNKLLSTRQQGIVIDYTTPRRVLELTKYQKHREIALVVCLERFFRLRKEFYALEYIYNDVHILLTVEIQNELLRINIYDCYPESYYSKDMKTNISVYKQVKREAYEIMEKHEPFALSCSIDDTTYAIFNTETSLEVKAIEIETYDASDMEEELDDLYGDCINSGCAGIDYNINLISLGL